MTAQEIRKKFINFFVKNQHIVIESSSLWPKDDPSVLLTTAGMQQFKPYFLGVRDAQADFSGKRLTSVQRCFRTSDIEEVGDATHCTFFEMLGNFSIGEYFKKEAIDFAWLFLTKELHLGKERLWITYFRGDETVAKDTEAVTLWKRHVPAQKIIGFGRQENWWGPPGKTGPCGPCSELHYDFTGQPCAKGADCLPNCECGRFMEVWNLVFMEYRLDDKGKLKELPSKNIDTGMGLDRLAFIVQKKRSLFETDLFKDIIKRIMEDTHFGSINALEDTVRCRIVADHLKATVFLLADGVTFSNKEQGYVARRVFRRALDQYTLPGSDLTPVIDSIIETYKQPYPFLAEQRPAIVEHVKREIEAYKKILQLNAQEIVDKVLKLPQQTTGSEKREPSSRQLTAQEAFTLYATYGLSPDRLKREGFVFDEEAFAKEIQAHQTISRAGATQKFGGHGLNSSEWTDKERQQMTCLHTATHLLHQALRSILGEQVRQQGSDIAPDRLRFDFEYASKLTEEQKQQVEELVNKKIKGDLSVSQETMPYESAIKSGALAFFKEKYPPSVSVYSIGDFSREVCGGPHVGHTGELGHFKIISEKSSSAGIRRIKATLE